MNKDADKEDARSICIYLHTHVHAHTHTQEYYSAIKNEILPFATMWMDLQSIIFSEISQTEKDKYSMPGSILMGSPLVGIDGEWGC